MKQFLVLKYADDGGFYYLTNNGKWSSHATPGYSAFQARFWINSGNAWNAIAKLVKNNSEKFEQLFVMGQNQLQPLSEDHADAFVRILNYTHDQGEIDAIAQDLIKEKSEQIELLDETLTELRVATITNSED